MEQNVPLEGSGSQAGEAGKLAAAPYAGAGPPPPQPAGNMVCETCGSTTTPAHTHELRFVYSIGRIEPRFPKLGVEKEFAQVLSREDSTGLTDRQALAAVLAKRENRYLARQLCWVFSVSGLETYLVIPRDPADLDLLIGSMRPEPSPDDLDVVVGVRGAVAPPDLCNGLSIPIVVFDQLYSFDRDTLLSSIPVPHGMRSDEEQFRATAADVLDRILQLTDNAGATPEHIALNYLAVRYPAVYAKAAEELAGDASLSGVETRPSRLSSTRRIVEVIFSFTNRTTDVTEKQFVRVDVTEEFPFLVTKLSPYYDR
jgi:hypothetical protein